MMNHQPQTPRRLHPHPALLTGRAKTRKVAVFAARGGFAYTQGCRVQRFGFGCTCVALNVAVNNKQKQRLIAQVQRCNGFFRFAHMCVRAHTPTRAHTRHTCRCTVAPLHLYYKVLIRLNISLQRRCNGLTCTHAKPLHLATARRLEVLALAGLNVVNLLFSLNNRPETFVYRGLMA